MSPRPYAFIDRDPRERREFSPTRSMTGADQRIARNPDTVSWLAKVYAEMEHGSRSWQCFDKKRLRSFLQQAGVDRKKAVDAHEDSLPIPSHLGRPEHCIPALKSASFLNVDVGGACVLIERRSREKPAR